VIHVDIVVVIILFIYCIVDTTFFVLIWSGEDMITNTHTSRYEPTTTMCIRKGRTVCGAERSHRIASESEDAVVHDEGHGRVPGGEQESDATGVPIAAF